MRSLKMRYWCVNPREHVYRLIAHSPRTLGHIIITSSSMLQSFKWDKKNKDFLRKLKFSGMYKEGICVAWVFHVHLG